MEEGPAYWKETDNKVHVSIRELQIIYVSVQLDSIWHRSPTVTEEKDINQPTNQDPRSDWNPKKIDTVRSEVINIQQSNNVIIYAPHNAITCSIFRSGASVSLAASWCSCMWH